MTDVRNGPDADGAPGVRYPWRATESPGPPRRDARPDLQGRRAGPVSRGLAAALDLGVVVLALATLYLVVAGIRFVVRPVSFRFPAPGLALLLPVALGTLAAYLVVAWTVVGRTYGGRLLGVRVVDARGDRLRWPTAAARAALCVLCPVGLFWVLVDGSNRSAQDVLLRTSAVYDWSTGG